MDLIPTTWPADHMLRLTSDFAATFSRQPAGVWMAPGRVNLIGDHTDYNDGFVLPLALRQQARAAVAPSDGPTRLRSKEQGGDLVTFSAASVEPSDVTGWGAYIAGVVWAFREAGYTIGDYDILLDSSVPMGAGLSSSAALECAAATALAELAGLEISRTELAGLARRAENDYVGAPTGVMDQMASLHGVAGQLMLLDCRSLDVRPVHLPLEDAGLALLVVDTRSPHALVDGQYAQRRRSCTEAAEILGVRALRDVALDDLANALRRLPDDVMRRRVRHVVTENARVLAVVAELDAGHDPRQIGPLLTASHASLRDDYEVSVEPVDVAVQAALDGGAYGARITGGGFGGCVIALIDADASDRIFQQVAAAYDRAGFTAPTAFLAYPSAGAMRLG